MSLVPRLCARVAAAAKFSTAAEAAPAASLSVATTTLSNGVKVVSKETGAPAATFGVAVSAGSRHESAMDGGASLLLKHMAFKGTTSRSDLALARSLEAEGLSANAVAGRELVYYSTSGLPSSLEAGMAGIAETALSPALLDWQVKETKAESLAFELATQSTDPQTLLTEALHEAAFGDETPMGRTFYMDPKGISAEHLVAYRAGLYTAENMTVVGAGVPHDQLVSLSECFFGSVAKGTGSKPSPASYVGGAAAVKADAPLTHVALGFNGAAVGSADAATVAVLKELLSHAVTSPSAAAFNITYSDSGIVGLYGAADPAAAGALTEDFVAAVKAMTAVDDAAVGAAKLAVKTQTLVASQESATLAASLATGAVTGVDAVSAASVKALASKLVKSPPAFASVGPRYGLPSYNTLTAMF